ncbi:hypothetical protein RRF57_011425 [Xylaria bambusicola]|uniref:Uncharacterized protein n=1 Tax=Xylaria bambusicola TaxID=326684 RepID=A0AAN7UUX5_9PEZI
MAYSPAEAQPPPIKHDTGYGPLNSRVEKYLLKNAPIFQQLTELREKVLERIPLGPIIDNKITN